MVQTVQTDTKNRQCVKMCCALGLRKRFDCAQGMPNGSTARTTPFAVKEEDFDLTPPTKSEEFEVSLETGFCRDQSFLFGL